LLKWWGVGKSLRDRRAVALCAGRSGEGRGGIRKNGDYCNEKCV
jgi:hypothetical protein